MTNTLGRRLGLGFAVAGLGSALLTAALVNLAFGDRFHTYLDQQRLARGRQLATAFATAYQPGQGWDTRRLDRLAPLVAMAGARVRLLDDSGEQVWSLQDSQMGPEMARMHRAMTKAGPPAQAQTLPVVVDGRRRGSLVVTLPTGTVPVADREFRRSVNWLLAGGSLGAGLVALLLGLGFARRTVRPVLELTAAARDLRSGDRARRATVDGVDEIVQLARAFNELVDSVEREDAVRRAFAADVAHELRTPLAILRSQLEAVQDGVAVVSPETVSSWHDETLRLGGLVADLETMTSAEAAGFALQQSQADLAQVAAAAATALEHRFADRRLELVRRLDAAPVLADTTRLRQVVTNLLTNTLKFVPAGGTVTLTTGVAGQWAELTVADDGPGIPVDVVPHVFERFYRGPTARANGSGIGLAVVAALVSAHGGHAEVVDAAGPGAVFRVRLPLADRVAPGGTRPSAEVLGEPPDHTGAGVTAGGFTEPSRRAPTVGLGSRRHRRLRRAVRTDPTSPNSTRPAVTGHPHPDPTSPESTSSNDLRPGRT